MKKKIELIYNPRCLWINAYVVEAIFENKVMTYLQAIVY